MALFGMFDKRERPLILHIDDSHLVLMTVQTILSALGYDSIQCLSGEDGIETAVAKKPDLILVDTMMPVMDGYQTIHHLRTRKETAAIPIIMLTGDDKLSAVEMALNSGANDYIVKPVKEERLKAKLEVLIKR